MSRDLHLWGLHTLTRKYCLADKFIFWADTYNIKNLELQNQANIIMKPHMKPEWKPDIIITHLYKKNGRHTN